MDKNTLKSSIKAYCLELMNEINSLGGGGEGAYLTKQAGRKLKKQDIDSPIGFESSPKNNYYPKFKFRLVKPTNKNSKQLWKEIKVNNPTKINFPIILKNQEQAQKIGKILFDRDYYWLNDQKPDYTNAPFKTNNFEPFKIFLVEPSYEIIDYEYLGELDESNYNLKETLHKRIKQTQMKLDEVNELDQYLYKIEGKQDKEINEIKNLLLKIQSQLKKSFNEIKVNKPGIKVWDFTKHTPDFNAYKIKIGDKIKTHKEEFMVSNIIVGINDFQTRFYGSKDGDYISKSSLIFMNNIRKNQ